MSVEDNIAKIKEMMQITNLDEVDLNDYYNETFEFEYPGIPERNPLVGKRIGIPALEEFISLFYELVEVTHMEVLRVGGAGDEVYVEGCSDAVVKKTGKPYHSDWFLLWRFKDGKVESLREYHDTAAITAAFAS